jgi:CRP/FNR family cyclic AMP-dependent transcriptional regulator
MGLLDKLRPKARQGNAEGRNDSILFSTAFTGLGIDASMLVPWDTRAREAEVKPLQPGRGSRMLQELWARDKYMRHLDADAIQGMERFMDFATVAAGRELIRQDEYGNFMLVLLSGSIAVDRVQPWGEQLRLAETRPGEILGEMSLLDSGIRFSACTTMNVCEIGALSAEAMDDMMASHPQLAANLIALLARKLSLRLRVVSARLSEQK